jgi:hypothetical protein
MGNAQQLNTVFRCQLLGQAICHRLIRVNQQYLDRNFKGHHWKTPAAGQSSRLAVLDTKITGWTVIPIVEHLQRIHSKLT